MSDDPILESKQGWKQLADISDAQKEKEVISKRKSDVWIALLMLGGIIYIITSFFFHMNKPG